VNTTTTSTSPYRPGFLPVARPYFRADIEGMRAVAILLVAGYHARVPGFGGGYVGVDVFFVLSGYLITWLLVAEAERTGTIDFVRFYSRRARRLLPALVVVMLVSVLIGAVVYAPFEHRDLANTAVATAAYLSNVYFAWASTDYLGAEQENNPLLHTWSLSVEEQFYLIWPLFVLLVFTAWTAGEVARGRRRLLLGMTAIAAVSLLVSVYLTGARQPWAFFLSPTRAWEFAAGALALLVPAFRSSPSRDAGGQLLGWVGLAGVLVAASYYDETTPFPGVAALLPVASTVLLLRANATPRPSTLARVLSARPLQAIGRLSYSWYLWHWPVLVFAAALYPDLTLAARLALLGLSLVLAETSFRLVEDPLRHNRWLSRPTWRSLAMAVVLTAFGVGLSFSWRDAATGWAASGVQRSYTHIRSDIPEIYAMDCDDWYYSSRVVECAFGDERAPRTAILIGDSHAGQWFSMVEPMTTGGEWKLVVMTKSACPVVDVSFVYDAIGRTYSECDQWRAGALERIRELSPDLVIVGVADTYPFTAEEWRAGTRTAIGAISASSERVVLIRDTPSPGFDVPTCLARLAWRPRLVPPEPCEFQGAATSTNAHEAQLAVVSGLENVHLFDVNGSICRSGRCRIALDDIVVFRDGSHVTDSFARSLAGRFFRYLAGVRPSEAVLN
jgi:peptidoglycan/LPS O-acetylase OafA/YrhL